MMPIRPQPATTIADPHEIPALLETIRETPPPESGVLSAYIATPLVPVAGRTYLISFREGCKSLRETVPPEAHKRFDRAVDRADRHLAEAFVPRQPGAAIISSTEN